MRSNIQRRKIALNVRRYGSQPRIFVRSFNAITKTLAARGICVQFIKENLTFTGDDSPMANLMLSVLGAVAQFERDLIKERQEEGIALAQKRGLYKGRKKALSPEQIEEVQRRAAAGEKKLPLAREFGIHRDTVYEYLKQSNGG